MTTAVGFELKQEKRASANLIEIGPIKSAAALLAPMSGITDLPFRRTVASFGGGLVFSEMVASRDLAKARPDVVLRTRGEGLPVLAVQLAGREAVWMAEGARVAEGLGAQLIDINMGCPARQVTRELSGSALMRDADHALSLIEAVVGAVSVPVTLKIRMGWDHDSLNAPEIAKRAEDAGVQMVTVHGRTRCQFYKGRANWPFIAQVKRQVSIPVIANGDILGINDARRALGESRADGVMIGRGVQGRPWLLRQVADALTGKQVVTPPLAVQQAAALTHYDEILSHYGTELGVRTARKHLGWYVEGVLGTASPLVKSWRSRLCGEENPKRVREALTAFYDHQMEIAA